MRLVAGRHNGDALPGDIPREASFGFKLVEDSVEKRGIAGVKAQFRLTGAGKRRL